MAEKLPSATETLLGCRPTFPAFRLPGNPNVVCFLNKNSQLITVPLEEYRRISQIFLRSAGNDPRRCIQAVNKTHDVFSALHAAHAETL